jgi:hypothetical protein
VEKPLVEPEPDTGASEGRTTRVPQEAAQSDEPGTTSAGAQQRAKAREAVPAREITTAIGESGDQEIRAITDPVVRIIKAGRARAHEADAADRTRLMQWLVGLKQELTGMTLDEVADHLRDTPAPDDDPRTDVLGAMLEAVLDAEDSEG